MNNKYYLKGIQSGKFFVIAAGFIAHTKAYASRLTEEQVVAVGTLGFEPGNAMDANGSFACNYIRKGDVQADGSIAANKRNPSKRRFATLNEAIQHGSRFAERRALAGDEKGTAGHVGFYITESDDPVNAEINWATGKTNPIAG